MVCAASAASPVGRVYLVSLARLISGLHHAPDQLTIMVAALLNSTPTLLGSRPVAARAQQPKIAGRRALVVRAGPYDEELVKTAVSL